MDNFKAMYQGVADPVRSGEIRACAAHRVIPCRRSKWRETRPVTPMVGLGARTGLPDLVDHTREPSANSPRGAEPRPAPGALGFASFASEPLLSERHVRLAPVARNGGRGAVNKRDFLSVRLRFLMLEVDFPKAASCPLIPVRSRFSPVSIDSGHCLP